MKNEICIAVGRQKLNATYPVSKEHLVSKEQF